MTVTSPTTSSEQNLHAALELSKKSWLLAPIGHRTDRWRLTAHFQHLSRTIAAGYSARLSDPSGMG